MLPIVFGHEAKSRQWPYVTVCLIGLNVIFFAFELSVGERFEAFLLDWGLVPARVNAEVTMHNLATVITSMFMHAGWLHIIFNLWFLYVFGDSLEGTLGHWWFLLLYLVAGFFGSIAFMATSSTSPWPAIGASGAIAGVMGASLVIWPTARLKVPGFLVAFFTFSLLLSLFAMIAGGGALLMAPAFLIVAVGQLIWFTHKRGNVVAGVFGFQDIRAWFVFGVFFLLNLWSGVGAIVDPQTAGGVGWWAHIGGFATGALFGWLFPKTPIALHRRRRAVLD